MFQSFFTGLSGMFSFSKNLDNVSNNIANLNTPGFKGSDTFYKSLTSGSNGVGTQIAGQQQRFEAGDIRQTGNPGDLAIGGEGFFILLNDGEVQYTRAGQFVFDQDGFLTDSATGARVAAVNDSGQLEPINIEQLNVLPPQATSSISFDGNLSTDMTSFTVTDVEVFDTTGAAQTLEFEFTNNSAVEAGSWLVEVRSSDGTVIHSGEIKFNPDGTPMNGDTGFDFDITDANGAANTISINIGEPGLFSATTSVSGSDSSTLSANVEDGYALSILTTVDFSADGTLQLNYANGETVEGPKLGLATFSDNSVLELVKGNVFRTTDSSQAKYSNPGQNGTGEIISESIELSNVDLSREFADMIIIQRGYQASSRILNVANQLLDQLYENTRGR